VNPPNSNVSFAATSRNIGFVFASAPDDETPSVLQIAKIAAPASSYIGSVLLLLKVSMFLLETLGWSPAAFRALGNPIEMSGSTIETVPAGTKVGPSEAALLNTSNNSMFTYGMPIAQIFDSGDASTGHSRGFVCLRHLVG